MTKILLVEDDKSLREIYGVRLLAEGYDIVSAGDGEEALAMAIKERPNLIISDVMMPKISGFDMLDILRSTTETKNIRVIMMTALSSEEQRQRGESLGADKYLVKSQVGIEDVVRVVHEVLDDSPVATKNFASTDFAQPAAPQAPAATAPAPTPTRIPVTNEPSPAPTEPVQPPRPASLTERVIQPLPSSQNPATVDLNALLDKELARETATPSYNPVAPTPPATAATADPSLAMPPEIAQQFTPPSSSPESPAPSDGTIPPQA